MSALVDVLVVDDDPRNLLAVQAVLEGVTDVRLTMARSGNEALRLLLEREFALILLDVHMPEMDGFETARFLRNSERTRHIPIIFLTANADVDRAAIAYAHGAVDYLFKPFVPSVLRAKVSVFVELQRHRAMLVEMEAREKAAAALAAANERLQAALARTEEALTSRTQFLRMASHELNTPLTSMRLTLDNVLRRGREPGTPPPDRALRALKIMDAQTARLTRLVEELLSVAVLEAGKLRMARQDADLVALVRGLVDTLDQYFAAAGCSVSVEGPDHLVGSWDPFWLQQAIVNLLTNACKFGSGRPITVHLEDRGAEAAVAVRDEGIGIASADHQRIFEPFERASSPDNYGGLGLGLYIAKRVVEDHGGTVRVESEPGRGSTFWLIVPRAPV